MTIIGSVESLWRYPVKSMQGQELDEIFIGFSGFFGDRIYAFKNSNGRKGFPYLNSTANPQMLRYKPQFRHFEKTLRPPNLFEAMSIYPGVNPSNAEAGDLLLDVLTPSGDVISIDDPALIDMLKSGVNGENNITLIRSDRALTDCRPISMISLETIKQTENELNKPIDKRRFRANVYFNHASEKGFLEEKIIGRRLRIGSKAEILVLEKDPRCKMISLDPESAEHDPDILRHVAKKHDNAAGIYCAVLVEGILKKGDSIELLD